MTTENQIQVNLQKFKSGKQNLGVIEDAIREAIESLKAKADELFYITESMNAEIYEAENEIRSLKEGLAQTMNSYYSEWKEVSASYTEQASELEANGIGFNNYFGELESNWRDINDYGQSILNK
jgi:hypothetical protein